MKCLIFIGSLIFVALDSIRILTASRLPLAAAKCIGELPLVLVSLFYTGSLFTCLHTILFLRSIKEFDFQSHFFMSKIGLIFLKMILCVRFISYSHLLVFGR